MLLELLAGLPIGRSCSADHSPSVVALLPQSPEPEMNLHDPYQQLIAVSVIIGLYGMIRVIWNWLDNGRRRR